MKTIISITGIRPDFIRMRNVFQELDKHFNHIMVHTGQHYDDELSRVFFKELNIRKPDFHLITGKNSETPYEQLAYLSKEIIPLFKRNKIVPDLTLFFGDSNSVLASVPLFKEGYKIGHIEGGMRSYDRRMPEETNRVVCDYVSDLVFVYTSLYKERLIKENKNPKHIFVVGNTITEIVKEYLPKGRRDNNFLVADIHRNENLATKKQYFYILKYLNLLGEKLQMTVKLVRFNRAVNLAGKNAYGMFRNIELIGPFGFLDYLKLQYHAYGVISDSGTAQEECPLLGVPVAVPRDFTERPESVENKCSILVGEHKPFREMVAKTVGFFKNYSVTNSQLRWLGDGKTSKRIVKILQDKL
jgi:UDP-N-acetylglucosamine 2-epimerase (non-hydrolysing)